MTYQLLLMVTLYFVPIALMGAAYTRIALCLWSSHIPSELLSSSGTVHCLCLKKNCTPKAGWNKFGYFPNTKKSEIYVL